MSDVTASVGVECRGLEVRTPLARSQPPLLDIEVCAGGQGWTARGPRWGRRSGTRKPCGPSTAPRRCSRWLHLDGMVGGDAVHALLQHGCRLPPDPLHHGLIVVPQQQLQQALGNAAVLAVPVAVIRGGQQKVCRVLQPLLLGGLRRERRGGGAVGVPAQAVVVRVTRVFAAAQPMQLCTLPPAPCPHLLSQPTWAAASSGPARP